MQFCGCFGFGLVVVAAVCVVWGALRLPSNGFVLPLAVLFGCLLMWTGAAVTAKRWRDLGVNPVGGVVGLWVALWVGDILLRSLHAGHYAEFWLPFSSYITLVSLRSPGERPPSSSSETLEPRVVSRRPALGLRR